MAFRKPSLGLAEIVWRWTVGAATFALLGATLLEYLHTLAVSPVDLLLFRSRHPLLVGRALAHIFAGSGSRIVAATVVLLIAFLVAWILVASVGRAVTLKTMLASFGFHSETSPLVSLAGLNFLRAGTALAALVGTLGCTIIAGSISTEAQPRPGLVFVSFLLLAGVVWSVWSMVNWFLSLAAIFVVRDEQNAFSALADAVYLCHTRTGPVWAVGSWFGLIHLLVFSAATVAACFPIALATAVPKAMTWFAIGTITLIYFAVADYLYVARLGAYVRIVEDTHGPSPMVPAAPVTPAAPAPEALYDPEDLILSDEDLILSDIETAGH